MEEKKEEVVTKDCCFIVVVVCVSERKSNSSSMRSLRVQLYLLFSVNFRRYFYVNLVRDSIDTPHFFTTHHHKKTKKKKKERGEETVNNTHTHTTHTHTTQQKNARSKYSERASMMKEMKHTQKLIFIGSTLLLWNKTADDNIIQCIDHIFRLSYCNINLR